MKLSKAQEEEYIFLLEEEFRENARRSMLDFTLYTRPKYEVNWHHRTICSILDKFVQRKIKRLMVFMPPRHGKSELVSRHLPAFIFGQNPDASVIATSYSASLATRMSRDVQKIMLGEQYAKLFPKSSLNPDENESGDKAKRTSSFFEIVGARGSYRAAGVGGGITGMGADFAIIDDPIKDHEEATSTVIRESIWNWYTSTLYTRLEKNACVLLTMTRWHEDDLAARLLAQELGDDWEVICFPAIKDDFENPLDPRKMGEALWPGKKNVGELEVIKQQSFRDFLALYQQTPRPEEGALIDRNWWKYYEELPAEFDMIIQSWDLAFTGEKHSDFVVGQVWGKAGANRYLLDQVRGRWSFTQTLDQFEALTLKWPQAIGKYVEEAANGAALIDTLKNKIPGIIPVKPRGKKASRVEAVSPQIRAGNVHLPHPSTAPWIHAYIEEFASFPYGKNDDQCDATSQGLTALNEAPMVVDWMPASYTKSSAFGG